MPAGKVRRTQTHLAPNPGVDIISKNHTSQCPIPTFSLWNGHCGGSRGGRPVSHPRSKADRPFLFVCFFLSFFLSFTSSFWAPPSIPQSVIVPRLPCAGLAHGHVSQYTPYNTHQSHMVCGVTRLLQQYDNSGPA